jgi:hypothetical protein
MLIDPYEDTEYSKEKFQKRRGFYERCGFTVKLFKKKA